MYLLLAISLFLLASIEVQALEGIQCDAQAPKFDYRDTGVISPVKDQGTIGSCVAFAWAGVIEALYKAKTGVDSDFSEQNLYNCMPKGKKGGVNPYDGAKSLLKTGLVDELFDPYKSVRGKCIRFNPAYYLNLSKVEMVFNPYHPASFEFAQTIKENLCTYGPLFSTVKMDKDFEGFERSKSPLGSFRSNLRNFYKTDHAISIVGWTEEGFIIKNSWSSEWGNNGFAVIKYGYNNIGSDTYYAIL